MSGSLRYREKGARARLSAKSSRSEAASVKRDSRYNQQQARGLQRRGTKFGGTLGKALKGSVKSGAASMTRTSNLKKVKLKQMTRERKTLVRRGARA